MESLLSAIASDLLSRALSMVVQKYSRSKTEETEHKLQRLHGVLLRIEATVEEAEGRYITNQAMLRQLDMLRQGMYCGHYMLDALRYRGHAGNDEVSAARAVALPRFNSTKLLHSYPVSSKRENWQNTVLDDESVEKLDKMLDNLETMISEMKEFLVFLKGYPRICLQPYSTYLFLEKVMFGRQMEKDAIINFLVRPEVAGDGNPGVLPIIGGVRVGKSTLVEHVCLDETVRGHFSLIVFFSGNDLCLGNMASLRSSGLIKHQDLTAAPHGRSLVVVEIDGDMEEETWRRLYSSAARSMGHGSKIIVTSRSEKISALGTTQALRLKLLPQEAYWYFFKTLAFGSANPNDEPKLAFLGMEIAVHLNGAFTEANIVASMLRTNLNAQFWRRVLQCLRDFTSKHLLMFGEHPADLIQKGQRVHLWRMARTQNVVTICKIYQEHSFQEDVPKLAARDILSGCATDTGKFRIVLWRSSIPPYYTYLATCASQTARCSMDSKKRPRQMRT